MTSRKNALHKSITVITLGILAYFLSMVINDFIHMNKLKLASMVAPFLEGCFFYTLFSVIMKKLIGGNIYKTIEFYLYFALLMSVYGVLIYVWG